MRRCVFCVVLEAKTSPHIYATDIVERFTLALMLLVVAFRNLIELNGSSFNFSEGFTLPKSFGWFRGNNVLWTIFYVRFSYAPTMNPMLKLADVIACLDGDDFRNAR